MSLSLFNSIAPLLLSVCVCTLVQGLGLLINLVEYSARNRHGLVDMEFNTTSPECSQGEAGGDETQTPEPVPASTEIENGAEPPTAAPSEGAEEKTKDSSSGALAALVQVRVFCYNYITTSE